MTHHQTSSPHVRPEFGTNERTTRMDPSTTKAHNKAGATGLEPATSGVTGQTRTPARSCSSCKHAQPLHNPESAQEGNSEADARQSFGASPEQRTAQARHALGLANAVRSRRRALMAELAEGRPITADDLVHPSMATCTVYDLLRAQRRWGRHKTIGMLDHLAIRERRVVGDLTERQSACLLHALEQKRLAWHP